MLEKKLKSQLLTDLDKEEQQLLSGGQTTAIPSRFAQMPQVLGSGFPNVPFLNSSGNMGQGEEIINSQGNKSGIVLY
ncbi:MAG TPA: hypothetical protein VK203_28825 [Nostocaceae cyanobacterium]|nr:hypothetical protein [Nostocaceae cyanobacterium]